MVGSSSRVKSWKENCKFSGYVEYYNSKTSGFRIRYVKKRKDKRKKVKMLVTCKQSKLIEKLVYSEELDDMDRKMMRMLISLHPIPMPIKNKIKIMQMIDILMISSQFKFYHKK